MSEGSRASSTYSLAHFGDGAILVTFEQRIDPLINSLVHAAASAVRAARADGGPWAAPVPGYASLLVPYDPLRITGQQALEALESLVANEVSASSPAADSARPIVEIPVRYGGDDGPDLAEVAEWTGLTAKEVIELHCSVDYRAYLLGFAPGFAYLGELPAQLELPRRATPRQRVPAGSVAIAGRQTAVYPLATPGGWHLIGRTHVPMWDVERSPPAIVEPGTVVRFLPRA